MSKRKRIPNKEIKGVVAGAAMNKTRVVVVKRRKLHKRYKKILTRTKRYLVEDSESLSKLGDRVEFIPCAPFSKRKRWKIIKIYNKNNL